MIVTKAVVQDNLGLKTVPGTIDPLPEAIRHMHWLRLSQFSPSGLTLQRELLRLHDGSKYEKLSRNAGVGMHTS